MNNNVIKEFSPIMTPDSMRKTLQSLKNFYGTHTQKTCGYEDINGAQYVGNIQNYGGELLLESRKILMNKPPLSNLCINDVINRYFDIQFSELIETYDQQSMFVATINKNTFLSDKEYTIRFDDINEIFVLRSESWSDPAVRRDRFVHTTTPPTLVIKDSHNTYTETSLKLSNRNDVNIHYYFFINSTSSDLIDTYDDKNCFLITKPLTDSMCGLPVIWMCVDELRYLPDVGFVNNTDFNGRPLLQIGTNGHDINRLYPLIHGSDNIPSTDKFDGKWYIKAIPVDGENFINDFKDVRNYSTAISKIIFFNTKVIGLQPQIEHEITFDNTKIQITLTEGLAWGFKTPSPGDYDYHSNAPCYAYIDINRFYHNIPTPENDRPDLYQAFDIKFNNECVNEYKILCGNAVSGIHVDSSSEYSDNGVIESKGVVHHLGDFDGLPEHFDYALDKSICRMHMELYSIRDRINGKKRDHVDKQTSALIIDSGLPKNEQISTDYTDPEIGRVYCISNDDISYKNNINDIKYKKPERCLARICDIPTSFIQLMKIDGKAPTFIIDENYYVRTEISYTNEDADLIWNDKTSKLLTRFKSSPFFIFTYGSDLNGFFSKKYLEQYYSKRTNMNESIDLRDFDGFMISSSGEGYSINDTFGFVIGGVYFKGVVTSVDSSDGRVLSILIESNDDAIINVNNLNGQTSIYQTTTTSGVGEGLSVELILDSTTWHSLQPRYADIFDDLYVFKFDEYKNIWVWKYDVDDDNWYQYQQITGYAYNKNEYDIVNDIYDDRSRDIKDVYINNILNQSRIINENVWRDPLNVNNHNTNIVESQMPIDVDLTDDLSMMITSMNKQDTYYVLTESSDGESIDIVSFERYEPKWNSNTINHYILPLSHQLNLSDYYNKSNSLSYSCDDYKNPLAQPTLCVYNPYKSITETVSQICTDVIKIEDINELTFIDIFDSEHNFVDIETGVLTRNVYVYDEYEMTPEMKQQMTILKSMSRTALISYIIDNFGYDTYPLDVENTEYQFSDQMLVDWIVQNSYNMPIYKKNDIRLFRQQGEKVVEEIDGKYVGVGKQPTGGYDVISTEKFNPNVCIDKKHSYSEITFVFRLDIDNDEMLSLKGFRIIDDNGYDVTEQSVLIYNKTIFVFINNDWVAVSR